MFQLFLSVNISISSDLSQPWCLIHPSSDVQSEISQTKQDFQDNHCSGVFPRKDFMDPLLLKSLPRVFFPIIVWAKIWVPPLISRGGGVVVPKVFSGKVPYWGHGCFIQVKWENVFLRLWNRSRITAAAARVSWEEQRRRRGRWWSRWSRRRSAEVEPGSRSGCCCCPFLVRAPSMTSWWARIFVFLFRKYIGT